MKPIYIFDLDGTLRNPAHRLHHILGEVKDWDAFYAACEDDDPIWPVINTLTRLQGHAQIWIWSGCSEAVMPQTLTWLHHHRVSVNDLKMRAVGDHREDHVIKKEWLDALGEGHRDAIIGVFEDRQQVVDMWRANGVFCFQVAEGKF